MPCFGKRSDPALPSHYVNDAVPCLALHVDALNHVAVPHVAVEDDVYGGFYIPKGE